MRFLNDELRSLQGLQPVHTAAQQQIPQINLQQFGISVAPTQTAPSFPAPYNSQGVYRQVQQQQMPSSSANVSNMSNVSTYQQLPSTSNSSQLYTASIGGSTASTYMGSTQHTQQQQQFHQQTHQQPQMQTYQQQSSYGQYQQQQQQLTQSMQSMPQQGGGYQASMSTSYVHPQQIQQTRQTHQQGHSQVHLPSALVVPEKPKSPILKPNPYVFTHTEDIYSGPAYRPIVYPGKNADGEQVNWQP
ncbi:hypothetical protein WR25_26497 [Diploscapter pachys]|uniref:Uncharacterized protein n=1 Tax=Diploscapter pachys TaxID=2018661 RepID=A0A2A2M2K5_9BILA|nr:hypothetical protein WR25_26497 [Diploscapter pachys]